MNWIETYRGTVNRWEADNVDHFTVAYYFSRFEDATLSLLDAIGLGREALGAGRAVTIESARVRYRRELRVGDILHIRSGVIGADGGGVALGHEVYDTGDGALCTTIEQGAVLVDAASRKPIPLAPSERERALAHRVPWDAPPGPAVSHPHPPPEDDSGFLDTARDTVKPWEVDTLGWAAPPAFIHRFTAANGHLLSAFGVSPAYMRSERRGFSTFEFDLAVPGVVRAGDLVRVRSALLHVGSSSMRFLHRMTDARTGAPVATLEQAGVHLDMDARRPTPLPDELRRRAQALLLTPTRNASVRAS